MREIKFFTLKKYDDIQTLFSSLFFSENGSKKNLSKGFFRCYLEIQNKKLPLFRTKFVLQH